MARASQRGCARRWRYAASALGPIARTPERPRIQDPSGRSARTGITGAAGGGGVANKRLSDIAGRSTSSQDTNASGTTIASVAADSAAGPGCSP